MRGARGGYRGRSGGYAQRSYGPRSGGGMIQSGYRRPTRYSAYRPQRTYLGGRRF